MIEEGGGAAAAERGAARVQEVLAIDNEDVDDDEDGLDDEDEQETSIGFDQQCDMILDDSKV